ncbi:MAG: PspC domain-containing protein [Actinomycetota bacterium]|nr:PspC domain-containing protein [Actinomycetota bacterium]
MTTNEPHRAGDHPLRRVEHGHLVAGVATGLAQYLDLDVAIVRVAIVAFTLLGGAGIPLYAAAWLLVPAEGADESVAGELVHRHQPA